MIACFLSNISAKYYKNSLMLSRVIAKNVGDVFLRRRQKPVPINQAAAAGQLALRLTVKLTITAKPTIRLKLTITLIYRTL